jgi:hypothetical protein
VTCRWFHRWGKWESEFDECPVGVTGVFEFRSRRCKRKRCNWTEEVSECVSNTPAVLRLNWHYGEAS